MNQHYRSSGARQESFCPFTKAYRGSRITPEPFYASRIYFLVCGGLGMIKKKCLLVGLLVLVASGTEAQEKLASNQKAAPVQEALSAFLTAFDNLDWPYSAIVSARRQLFSSRRRRTLGELILPNSSKRHGSPSSSESRRVLIGLLNHTLLLNRSDLRVEELSEEVALVTFHLVDGGLVNRRTLVFKHKTSGWKIVHIHASNIAPP